MKIIIKNATETEPYSKLLDKYFEAVVHFKTPYLVDVVKKYPVKSEVYIERFSKKAINYEYFGHIEKLLADTQKNELNGLKVVVEKQLKDKEESSLRFIEFYKKLQKNIKSN